MLKEFLKNGLSAAGISRVVTTKSHLRRILWILALIFTSLTMVYMTYNVLQEYLKYPVVMHMKRTSKKEMEFPAVTVCSYSLIPRIYANEANLQHMEEMAEILEILPQYNISARSKVQCLKDPLCRWSRFVDKCFCDQTACASTECYPYKNEKFCACSEALCSPSVSDVPYNCTKTEDEQGKTCICRRDYENPKYNKKQNERITPDFLEALHNLDVSLDVKNLLQHIKNSTSNNLRDKEKFFKPNITVRDNYGISYENLILSCTFQSQPCNIGRDASTLYSPSYGKCYMFNYAGEQDTHAEVKIVNHAGKSHGLELYLKNPKSNTLPLFSSQYGARVVIHDPRSLPFASQNGFDIRAGDLTSVIVGYREVNRLGSPWGDCGRDGDNETSDYLEIPYSKLGCERRCLNNEIFERCKCFHTMFLSGTLIPVRKHICQNKDETCVMKVAMDIFRNRIHCKCPPPCREKTYDVSISAGKINREFFRMLKISRSLRMINGSPAVAEPEFKLGMMGLHVYFGSFAVTNTSETSIYSWQFLVANIGGNLGLFLGLSLITFVEIAEFVVDISLRTFCRMRRRRKCCSRGKNEDNPIKRNVMSPEFNKKSMLITKF